MIFLSDHDEQSQSNHPDKEHDHETSQIRDEIIEKDDFLGGWGSIGQGALSD